MNSTSKVESKRKKSMNKIADIRRVEFVLAVDKHNPILFNPEFLKAEGIIPNDWELTEPPTYIQGTALVVFQNGIYIAHQGNIIAFFEDTRTKHLENLEVPQIVQNYVELFPDENYRAVGLNLEGHTTFNIQEEARNYLLETLQNPNYLHELDEDIVQTIVNFIYKIDRGQLTLTVRNTELKRSAEESIPVILFAANFNRNVTELPNEERFNILSQTIRNWQTDIDTYQEIINNRFLNNKVKQFV